MSSEAALLIVTCPRLQGRLAPSVMSRNVGQHEPCFVFFFWPLPPAMAPLVVVACWHPLLSCTCNSMHAQPATMLPLMAYSLGLAAFAGGCPAGACHEGLRETRGPEGRLQLCPCRLRGLQILQRCEPRAAVQCSGLSCMVALMACPHCVLRWEAAMATSSGAKGDFAPHYNGAYSIVPYRAAMV